MIQKSSKKTVTGDGKNKYTFGKPATFILKQSQIEYFINLRVLHYTFFAENTDVITFCGNKF